MTTRVGRRTFLKMAGVAAPVVAAYSCADKDEAARRGAWEGLRSIESFVLDHGFLEIVKKRNRLGRMLGGEDRLRFDLTEQGPMLGVSISF